MLYRPRCKFLNVLTSLDSLELEIVFIVTEGNCNNNNLSVMKNILIKSKKMPYFTIISTIYQAQCQTLHEL